MDIAQSVHKLAQFCSNLLTVHWSAVKCVLRYVKGTKSLGLFYQPSQDTSIAIYSDADYAGDLDERKSTSGYMLCRNGAAVSWKSKKQTVMAMSTAEAEYIALYLAVQECV